MKRLLDYDAQTLTSTFHDYDPLTDTTYIEEVQDVQPILERNKAIQNTGGKGKLSDYSRQGIKNSWWHTATIPNGVQMKWRQEHGVDIYNKNHWPKVRQLLNSPDYRYLRTGTGTI